VTIRRAGLRRVPPQLQPLTASSTVGATVIDPPRVGGRRVSLLGSRPSLPVRSMLTACLKPTPIISQRWPPTGSARMPAIRSPNASSPRCSDAPPVAGHVPGSPKHGNHHESNPVVQLRKQSEIVWRAGRKVAAGCDTASVMGDSGVVRVIAVLALRVCGQGK
jgi:hypothetical protein